LNKELTKSTSYYARVRNSLAVCFIAFNFLFLVPPAYGEEPLPEVTTIVTNGGDDVSYQIPLTVSVVYDGVTYENVYATTNSVITFGRADGTFWDYPTTPSISIESKDWWVLPQQMPDTHFILNVSEGGFQVDGSYRPYGTFTGDTTQIVITAQIQTDGTVAYTYNVTGPLTGNERTGARLTDGTVVPLEEANIIEVEEVPVLEPTPVEPEPSPESSPTPTTEPSTNEALPLPTPSPTPTPNPSPTETTPLPTPLPVPVEPTPVVVPQPSPEPVIPPVYIPEPEIVEPPIEEPETQPLPTPEPEPEPELEPIPVEPEPTPEPIEPEPIQPEPPVEETEEPIVQADEIDLETLAPDTPVELSNGVVITAEQAIAVQLLQDPAALLQELFTDPAAAFAALGSVGADMTEEEREESEKVIIAAVIAGNIATTAATSAAGAAAIRRKP
jgi:hypothetical protein